MDDTKVKALQERLFTELNGAMSILNMYIGDKLGMFTALAETGPTTAQGFAEKTELNERYIREWLECMAAGQYLDYDGSTSTFSLSPEHALVFTSPDHPASGMGVFGWLPSFVNILPDLLDAFKTGAGVPYEAYGLDMVNGQGARNPCSSTIMSASGSPRCRTYSPNLRPADASRRSDAA
jgi:hypothetical protein